MKKLLAILLVGAAGMGTAIANDYSDATRNAISKAATDYKAAKVQCDAMKGNAKTVCIDEAKAKRAHAEASAVTDDHTSTARAKTKAMVAAADADYELARAQCNDKAKADKATCMNDAKASHSTALADARANRQADRSTADTSTSGTSGMAGTSGTAGTTGSGTPADRTTTSRTGEVMADTTITTKIKADLVKEPDLTSTGIHVETVKGVVMLSGFVNSKAQADRAVEVARGVDGVKKVESALKVK